jgi:hypothetical protein
MDFHGNGLLFTEADGYRCRFFRAASVFAFPGGIFGTVGQQKKGQEQDEALEKPVSGRNYPCNTCGMDHILY